MVKNRKKTFVCKLCGKEFPKKQISRIKLLSRLPKGEDVSWICAKCAKEKIKIIT
ncbi:MAG: hypothetical protein HWN66_10435 [Candidatus Helarchaeota archaeon]|nr:hypothetical protein [Candidatus Helarchaeota archaeon]